MRYSFTISQVPNKNLVTADTSSRTPVSTSCEQDEKHHHEVKAYVNFVHKNCVRQTPGADKRTSAQRRDLLAIS